VIPCCAFLDYAAQITQLTTAPSLNFIPAPRAAALLSLAFFLEATNDVKKHLLRVFAKLGLETHTAVTAMTVSRIHSSSSRYKIFGF